MNIYCVIEDRGTLLAIEFVKHEHAKYFMQGVNYANSETRKAIGVYRAYSAELAEGEAQLAITFAEDKR